VGAKEKSKMNREEIITEIANIISAMEGMPNVAARKIIEFLEDIGYDVESSITERATREWFRVQKDNK
jgi:hypothetical protein